MKRQSVLLLSMISIIFLSCVTHFNVERGDYKAVSNKIAVIAGDQDPSTVFFANSISKELVKISTLDVLSKSAIANSISGYPVFIQGPFKKGLATMQTVYESIDKNKINQLQKNLGADYIVVIWLNPERTDYYYVNTNTNEKTLSYYETTWIGVLYIYPDAKQIGLGGRKLWWYPNDVYGINTKEKLDSLESTCRESAVIIADNIARGLGVRK